MGKYAYICSVCAAPYQTGKEGYVCPNCGGQLEPVLPAWEDTDVCRSIIDSGCRTGVWDYAPLLPVEDAAHKVSLQEGNTPLVEAENLAARLGLKRLLLKNETRNPSGTYKDRFATVAVTVEKENGTAAVALGSAGNAAAAVSAYCAKAKLPCFVFLPPGAVAERAWQVRGYGAHLIRMGTTIHDCISMAQEGERLFGWRALVTNMRTNPLGSEGYKSIAYELGKQVGYEMPDWILVPVGGGALLSKIYRGCKDMMDLGMIHKMPRFVGVQAEGCAPLVAAFQANQRTVPIWPKVPDTVAFAIADIQVYDGEATLDAIYRTKGLSVAVSDADILDAMHLIAQEEAIVAEPASATTIACVRKLLQQGLIREEEHVACILSGNGMRDLKLMEMGREEIPYIPAGDLQAVETLVRQILPCTDE